MATPAPNSPWFELQVDRAGNEIRITTRGSADVGTAPQSFALGLDELQRFARSVQHAAKSRMPLASEQLAQAQAIQQVILEGEIGALFHRLRQAAGGSLLLRLAVHDPELQAMPWEALCDQGTDLGFWGTSSHVRPVRSIVRGELWQPHEVRGAMRVLAIAPTSGAGLENLKDALHERIVTNEITWLEPIVGETAKLEHLFRQLRSRPSPHVVHFIGHIGVDPRGRPALRMGDDDEGEETWLPAELLAQHVEVNLSETLRLIVLEACEGAKASEFASAALKLAETGTQAVVAHLWPVRADVARTCSKELYHGLMGSNRGGDIAAAMNGARRAILTSYGTSAEAHSPVLFLRGTQTQIFRFSSRTVTANHPPIGGPSKLETFIRQAREDLLKYPDWSSELPLTTSTPRRTNLAGFRLEEIFVPLRFRAAAAPPTDHGTVPDLDSLFHSPVRMIIRGTVGQGKTTWIAWAFRNFLEQPLAFPLLLKVKEYVTLAATPNVAPEYISIRGFLDWQMRRELPDVYYESWLPDLLERDDLRVVLLVDGWDESGERGQQLRRHLDAFLKHNPRVAAVVTSRPYGAGCPGPSDGFDEYIVQPLDVPEVQALVQKFYRAQFPQDEQTRTTRLREFFEHLAAADPLLGMAQSPALLTIMLMPGGAKRLPSKPHQLYHRCIQHLLSRQNLIKKDEPQSYQYKPADMATRWDAIEHLGWGLHARSYPVREPHASLANGTHAYRHALSIETVEEEHAACDREELAKFLPLDWPQPLPPGVDHDLARVGFIDWLFTDTHLLTDRSDDKLAFSLQAIQEYLAARYLHRTRTDEPSRASFYQEHMNQPAWWHVARLWAGLLFDDDPTLVDSILGKLVESNDPGVILAGLILADGNGSSQLMERWVDRFVELLMTRWPAGAMDCSIVWSVSSNVAFRRRLEERCASAIAGASLPHVLRLERFVYSEDLASAVAPPPPLKDIAEGKVTERVVAMGRIFAAANPLWPFPMNAELALLNLWPGRRRRWGLHLQLAAFCGATRQELAQMIPRFSDPMPRRIDPGPISLMLFQPDAPWELGLDRVRVTPFLRKIACETLQHLAHDVHYSISPSFDAFAIQGLIRQYTRIWSQLVYFKSAQGVQSDTLMKQWRQFIEAIARLPMQWVQYWMYNSEWDTLPELVSRIHVHQLGIEPLPHWAVDFIALEKGTLGWGCARTLIAEMDGAITLITLFAKACKLSLDPKQDPNAFIQMVAEMDGAPEMRFWLPFACHIARLSNGQDREQLEDSVRHPEKQADPFSWGLRYMVRGDVMLLDGSVVTLDELSDELNLPRLPYVEEMPEEIELPLSWLFDGAPTDDAQQINQ